MSSFTDSRFFIIRDWTSFGYLYKLHDLATGETFGAISTSLDSAINDLDSIRFAHGEPNSDLFFLDDLVTLSEVE